jgi:acyl carrier protein
MEVTIEEVKKMVCLQLGLGKVSVEDLFMEDLGAESADLVNIVATAEDKFRVSLGEADIARARRVLDLYELLKKYSMINSNYVERKKDIGE